MGTLVKVLGWGREGRITKHTFPPSCNGRIANLQRYNNSGGNFKAYRVSLSQYRSPNFVALLALWLMESGGTIYFSDWRYLNITSVSNPIIDIRIGTQDKGIFPIM